jgi:hypothetical protein
MRSQPRRGSNPPRVTGCLRCPSEMGYALAEWEGLAAAAVGGNVYAVRNG